MFPAILYNSLPTVNEARDLAQNRTSVRNELISIIAEFGLGDELGVRLVHKHFDVLEDEVMVFRHVKVEGICEAIVMGPVQIAAAGALQAKNFVVDDSGTLKPYEFTTNGGVDLSQYPTFVLAFTKAVVNSGSSRVFGLVAKPKQLQEDYTEFELPDLRSTIMLPERMVPKIEYSESISTNWVVGEVEPEPVDGCTQTRSGAHHGLYCLKTRSDKHYVRGKSGFIEPQLESMVNQVLAVM